MKASRKCSTLALEVRVLHGLGRLVDVHHHGPLEVRYGAGPNAAGARSLFSLKRPEANPRLRNRCPCCRLQGRMLSLKVRIFQGIEPAT